MVVCNIFGEFKAYECGRDGTFGSAWTRFHSYQYKALTSNENREILMKVKHRYNWRINCSLGGQELDDQLAEVKKWMNDPQTRMDLIQCYGSPIEFRVPDFSEESDRVMAMVKSIMRAKNIPLGQYHYFVEDVGPKLQEWLDDMDPGKYKIYLFRNKVRIWSSVLPEGHRKAIMLADMDGVICPIKTARAYLKRQGWCQWCERYGPKHRFGQCLTNL